MQGADTSSSQDPAESVSLCSALNTVRQAGNARDFHPFSPPAGCGPHGNSHAPGPALWTGRGAWAPNSPPCM